MLLSSTRHKPPRRMKAGLVFLIGDTIILCKLSWPHLILKWISYFMVIYVFCVIYRSFRWSGHLMKKLKIECRREVQRVDALP